MIERDPDVEDCDVRSWLVSPKSTPRSLAYHEAGHSVAAYVQRCTDPGRVTINPDEGRGLAEIVSYWNKGNLKDVAEQTIMCWFSGPAAEAISQLATDASDFTLWHRCGPWVDSSDWRFIRRLLRKTFPEFKDVPNRTMVKRISVRDPDRRARVALFDAKLEELKTSTTELIREHWPLVDAVARTLLQTQTLEEAQLKKLMNSSRHRRGIDPRGSSASAS